MSRAEGNKLWAILDAWLCVSNLIAYFFGVPMMLNLIAAGLCGAFSALHFYFYLQDRKKS